LFLWLERPLEELTLVRGAILAIPLLLLLLLVLNAGRLGRKVIPGSLVGVIALSMMSYFALPQVE
jgi:O-antigen ligase